MFAAIFGQYIVPILGTGLGTMASYVLYKGIQWLQSKVQSNNSKHAIEELDSIIKKSVQATEQTFVKHLKEQNQWGNASGYIQAASKTFEQVKHLASRHIKTLKAEGLDIEPYIMMSIEAFISQMKRTS